jgi:hypothetical protein
MALSAGIIFGEKTWSKGIWVARCAGVGLAIVGTMAALGLIIIPSDMNDNGNSKNENTHNGWYQYGYEQEHKCKKPVQPPTIVMPSTKNM